MHLAGLMLARRQASSMTLRDLLDQVNPQANIHPNVGGAILWAGRHKGRKQVGQAPSLSASCDTHGYRPQHYTVIAQPAFQEAAHQSQKLCWRFKPRHRAYWNHYLVNKVAASCCKISRCSYPPSVTNLEFISYSSELFELRLETITQSRILLPTPGLCSFLLCKHRDLPSCIFVYYWQAFGHHLGSRHLRDSQISKDIELLHA